MPNNQQYDFGGRIDPRMHGSLPDSQPYYTAEQGVRDAGSGAGQQYGIGGGAMGFPSWRPPMGRPQQGFQGDANPGPQQQPWQATGQRPNYGPAPNYQMPVFNLPPGLMGGGGKLGQASWENPNIAPFLSDVMGHNVNMAGLGSQDYRARIGALSQGDVARQQADASRYGSYLQNQAAMGNIRIQDLIAQAQYGEGGLSGRQMTLQEQRPEWEAEQAALQRQFGTSQQAAQLASQERVAGLDNAFLREIMGTPMLQNVFGGGGQGFSTAPSSMQSYGGGMGGYAGPGLNEQEFLRGEGAAQGRRAADEAAMVKNDMAAATGPGGAGMGGGPARSAAERRAQLFRLQSGERERGQERRRLMEMQLAQRGQNLGFAGGIFS